ncbi:hypothetical protein GDO86_010636 [Hymenochirus boettgeri]|uniref:Uncharacterized protein n=1 Tax=Hymenochirus boettgeri TaxID=247094 RepID=A0A8T2JQS5_9PIPI|nr:hypothetical protein GDO86_010636 [Hymenochirus boettgeri]
MNLRSAQGCESVNLAEKMGPGIFPALSLDHPITGMDHPITGQGMSLCYRACWVLLVPLSTFPPLDFTGRHVNLDIYTVSNRKTKVDDFECRFFFILL